jgi:C1A family cysteine protease
METRSIKKYGWLPDLPDHRDLQFSEKFTAQAVLPASVDLSSKMPAVYDQGELGSCTANAIGAAFEYDLIQQKLPSFTPSRLFIYYNERSVEGTIKSDAGAMIRDGIKVVNKLGACKEVTWTYDITKFAKKPTTAAFKEAMSHLGVKYYSVNQTENDVKTALASGFPVVFGFTVYEGFESPAVAKTGVLNMPTSTERQLGGHAVLIVGYDDAKKQFKVRNSWGSSWGMKGYFVMPYQYVTNPKLASDFWVLQQISG